MNRIVAVLLIIIAFGAGTGAGVLGILWATGGVSEPSQDTSEAVQQLSLDEEPAVDEDSPVSEEIAALSEQVAALSTQVGDVSAQIEALEVAPAAAAPTEAMDPTPVPTEAEAAATEEAVADTAAGDIPYERALFRIDEEQSEARFNIPETLSGTDIVVVGTTQRVAGDVIVNAVDPAQSEVGEIAINVRTLRTDNEFRDQAIRGRILGSSQDQFEFVRFAPTQVTLLNEGEVVIGEPMEFQITGDLTIKDTTNEVTFDTEITPLSTEEISGYGTTDILYADYGITINAPPTVSNIGDVVTLELEFVANLVEQQ